MSLLKQTFTEEQIKEFEEWKAKKQKPHPMFKTTASEIGTAPIGVTPELKPPAHPRTGTFSKGFIGSGMYKDQGLNTGVIKSKVHSKFDTIF